MKENIKTVMLVDDIPANLRFLQVILQKNGYRVVAFPSGNMAVKAVKKNPPDLILLDIMMPEMDGFEVCETIKTSDDLAEIPIIFVSALNNPSDKAKAFEVGGVDFITKPYQSDELISRVKTHIKMYEMQKNLDEYDQRLEDMVSKKNSEIYKVQKTSSYALAKLVELKDYSTGKHIERVQKFSLILSKELRNTTYRDSITNEFLELMYFASPLHDLGKVGVSDSILLKPGKLEEVERKIMQNHVAIGADTLEAVFQNYPNDITKMGIEINRYHHEKWDGTGYLEGLKGLEIPLSARIMALVDAYDAIRSERPYKKSINHFETCKIIEKDIGTHFDPVIGGAFLNINNNFKDIFGQIE